MKNTEFVTFCEDKKLLATSEIAARERSSYWHVLVVDDDIAIHEVTQLVLKNLTIFDKKIVIHSAYSAQEAKELMLTNITFAFALIDVVMETDTAGLSLVKWIRESRQDADIRLVLRTGQSGEAPEQEVICQYDIHDYKEKNELTAKKLFTLIYSCIRTYDDIIRAKKMQKLLRHSEKMEAVGQLASGIVHDFNNILGVILGNVELLQQIPNQDEKQQIKLSCINKAALMGKNIVKKLHSFTTNKLEQKESANINNIITKMNMVIDHASTNLYQLDYHLDRNIWPTHIVVNDFESALFNLIINAHDAISTTGKIAIKTSNCVLDDKFCQSNPNATAGEYILLEVSDNGIGISAQSLPRLFEPFYTTKTQGTGMGLALVLDFVSRSFGYITVQSTLETGTTFNLYLPKFNVKN